MLLFMFCIFTDVSQGNISTWIGVSNNGQALLFSDPVNWLMGTIPSANDIASFNSPNLILNITQPVRLSGISGSLGILNIKDDVTISDLFDLKVNKTVIESTKSVTINVGKDGLVLGGVLEIKSPTTFLGKYKKIDIVESISNTIVNINTTSFISKFEFSNTTITNSTVYINSGNTTLTYYLVNSTIINYSPNFDPVGRSSRNGLVKSKIFNYNTMTLSRVIIDRNSMINNYGNASIALESIYGDGFYSSDPVFTVINNYGYLLINGQYSGLTIYCGIANINGTVSLINAFTLYSYIQYDGVTNNLDNSITFQSLYVQDTPGVIIKSGKVVGNGFFNNMTMEGGRFEPYATRMSLGADRMVMSDKVTSITKINPPANGDNGSVAVIGPFTLLRLAGSLEVYLNTTQEPNDPIYFIYGVQNTNNLSGKFTNVTTFILKSNTSSEYQVAPFQPVIDYFVKNRQYGILYYGSSKPTTTSTSTSSTSTTSTTTTSTSQPTTTTSSTTTTTSQPTTTSSTTTSTPQSTTTSTTQSTGVNSSSTLSINYLGLFFLFLYSITILL